MNTYWKITASLRHVRYHRGRLRMRLETLTYLWPIVFPKKQRQNKMDFLLTKPFCLCVCVRACVCLGLVLLLVRWVSVKRITTVSLLYPHTLSQRPTFTRPTFHAIQPPPAALFDGDLKKKKNPWIFIYERQNNIFSYSDSVAEAGLKWSMYVEPETIFFFLNKGVEKQLKQTVRKVCVLFS